MPQKTYDPGLVTVSFLGNTITGWAKGTFLKASRNEDSFKVEVGATGEVSRVRSQNRSGRVVFTLAQTSSSNDVLAAAVKADENGGEGVGAIQVKDGGGTTLIDGENAWVVKPADVEFGDEVSHREWTIEVGSMAIFVGGTDEA